MESLFGSAGMVFLAMILSAASYLQWFELVPQITKFFKEKYASHDLDINILVEKKEPVLLTESAIDWSENVFDKQEHSPIKRVFKQNKD